jgi:hypothetical protein
MEEQGEWMNEITEKTETLKIEDGQTVIFTFINGGVKKSSEDYGNSIMFTVLVEGQKEHKTFYVRANNFDFLGQIKALAKDNKTLVGLKVNVSRRGSKRSDTRYTISKA